MKVAVVTGANKGIGFAIVKALCKRFDGIVYLTSRDTTRGIEAVANLRKDGLNPEYHQLDVADRESVTTFRDFLKEKHGGIDILINNAAITGGLKHKKYEVCKEVIDIIYRGLLMMQELIFPLVKDYGRILNIASNCGHLSNVRNQHWRDRLSNKNFTLNDVNDFVDWYLTSVQNGTFNADDIADGGTIPAYRVAKVAICALTMLQQKELKSRNISVNSVHPGLVKTDMTFGNGDLTPDEAAETPVYLVLDAPQDLKGAYVWHDRTIVDWYDYKSDYYFTMKSLLKDFEMP